VERKTVQRDAIRNAFVEANRPLSPQEVLDGARVHVPKIGIATVYRTVKALTDEGWLAVVELPGEPQRYEVSGKEHHHHFSCRACGRVFELHGCAGDFSRLAPKGFETDDHEIYLYGRCAECVGARNAK